MIEGLEAQVVTSSIFPVTTNIVARTRQICKVMHGSKVGVRGKSLCLLTMGGSIQHLVPDGTHLFQMGKTAVAQELVGLVDKGLN